ncbi:prefoldin subunit 6, partial [Passerculus sandwichensis]
FSPQKNPIFFPELPIFSHPKTPIFFLPFSQNLDFSPQFQELNLLDDSTTVFKLLGPVLVKQDLEEAKNTVGKRLEYISGEMKRYEQQMQELERRSEQQRELLGRLQQELQAKP